MLNLAEYHQRPALLADWLPWAGLVAPGVVLNKDGSFQRTARFRGPDLDSATQGELIATTARLNNALRRLGSGWALFVEAERRPAAGYPHSVFPEPLSWLVDEERRATFEQAGSHYESGYHLTLVYLPPEESRARAAKLLYENTPTSGADWRERLAAFIAETGRVFDLLDGVMPEIAWLDDGETLTYLHATISTRRFAVAVPEVPFHLDALLADVPLAGGLAPRLGDQHLRVVTVRGFPTSTWPGLLDDLNRLGFAYRWCTRFLCLDKAEAEKELTRLRRQWFAKRKNVVALLRETIFQQESPLVDTDASNKATDADAALQELGSDQVAFGYVTATVTVMDADATVADEKLRQVERAIQGRGFVTIPETLNAVEAWLSSIPGHAYANVRQPSVSTLNLAHLMPVSAVWAGPEKNAHLDGPPLIVTRTAGDTPFRLVTHIGDVGHTLVVGPTGMGKSVLLAVLALQFRRYPGSRIFAFDMGRSMRATILGLAAVTALLLSVSSTCFAVWPVFDATNYSQNLLTAARALQQIDNQIQQLQNEATMLVNQGRNLASLPYSVLSQLQATLASTNQLIAQAQGLSFNVAQSQAAFNRLYPSSYGTDTSNTQMVQDAQTRWQTSVQALQTATQMQSQAAQNLLSDQGALSNLVAQSQGAVGALQASQATNQLLALISRQAIQAQQLAVSQGRATALDQARAAADEAQAERVRARFLGNGPQYTPQPVDFYGN